MNYPRSLVPRRERIPEVWESGAAGEGAVGLGLERAGPAESAGAAAPLPGGSRVCLSVCFQQREPWAQAKQAGLPRDFPEKNGSP